MLEMKNIEILLFLINNFGPAGYEDVANKFITNILHKIKECRDDYNYYQVKAPWLQIKIRKIVQLISLNMLPPETVGNLKEFIEEIGKKTYATTMNETKSVRFYSKYCVFFEVINVVDHLNAKLPTKIFDTYVSILGNFLKEDSNKYPNKDINTKYLALDGMAKLAKYSSGDRILKEHSTIIYSSLKDNDISIRRRALDLLFLVCSVETVKSICKELLLYFKEDEPQLKEDIALKLAILAEKYTTDLT
jgi:AP-2 complex subunit alpha